MTSATARTTGAPSDPAAPPVIGVPVNEAARQLGCSRETVYRLLRSGELRSYTLGRTRRVTVESIEAVAASTTDAAST